MSEFQGPIPRVPRAEVRMRLLVTASEVFSEVGYDTARLEEIAERAGFTRGAIYSNFGSKQGLFAAVLAERAETERTMVIAAAGEGGSPRIADLLASRIVEDTQRGGLGLEFAARATRDDAVRDVLAHLRREQRSAAEGAIDEVTKHRDLRLTVQPDIAALILHCLTNGLAMEHLIDPEQVDQSAVKVALSAAIDALTTEKEK